MAKEFYRPKPAFIVETGARNVVTFYDGTQQLRGIIWEFERAFLHDPVSDPKRFTAANHAKQHADRLAETHEYVRVIIPDEEDET